MLSTIESWFSVFMLFCASQAVTGLFLLLSHKERPFANNMLALLFISWGFSCYWFFAFIQKEPFFSRAVTTFIGPMISLTLFPPIFLYIRYLFREYNSFRKIDHLHFVPVYLFLIVTFYLWWAGDFTIEGMRAHPWYHARTMVCSFTTMILGPCYFYATNRIMKLRYKKLLEEYSDIESKKLHWLRIINFSFALIFIIGGLSTIIRTTHFNPYFLYLGYHVVMGVSLFYITIKIFSLPELFFLPAKNEYSRDYDFQRSEAEGLALEEVTPHGVINTTITLDEMVSFSVVPEEIIEPDITVIKDGEIVKKLDRVMNEQKLYKDPNINLHDLAYSISETRNNVSNVLNNRLHKAFYDYINELRVEESKKLLSDPKRANYTIEAIASEAGFKTMSVFYRFFKDIVKTTPTQYRKQVCVHSEVIDN